LSYFFSSFQNQTFHKISICETRAKNSEVGRIVGCRGKCFPFGGSERGPDPTGGHPSPLRTNTPSQMIGSS
jgi:hypothetical protein